jgi:hypothetical protein
VLNDLEEGFQSMLDWPETAKMTAILMKGDAIA